MLRSLLFLILLSFGRTVVAQIEFVENKGQWHENVVYRGDFKTGSFFLERDGFTVMIHDTADLQLLSKIYHPQGDEYISLPDNLPLKSFAYKVRFEGGNNQPYFSGEKKLDSYNNYFIGEDSSKWSSGCRIFYAVQYRNIYPNIDVRYYSEGDALKYDFIIHPGGNPANIRMRYEGPELSLLKNELLIKTSVGTIKELYPYSYQQTQTGKTEVACKYVLNNDVVSFNIKRYDSQKPLIIDPSVIFCSFTGSTADNWGYTATPGPDGSLYGGGIVFAQGFPVSPGAIQTNYGGGVIEGGIGGYDIGLFRFSANGSSRMYATYLGGTGNEQPHSLIADADGNLIVAGRTSSPNFPITTAVRGSGGATDIFVTKFNAAGTAILGSMRIGGSADDGVNIRAKYIGNPGTESIRRNYGDDARSEVILDNANNIILASCTQSNDFYVTPGVVQSTYGGGIQDGVIVKFTPNLDDVIFSTYFGGALEDACFVTAINPIDGNIYVGGVTASSIIPGNRTNVWQPDFNLGFCDGFITIINPLGTQAIKTTFVGTGGIDVVYGLKFDKSGFPYTMGTSTGVWPIVRAAFSNVNARQFIVKLQPDLSDVVYSTVFGKNSSVPDISPVAFMVDRCENVYVSGWGGGINNTGGYTNGSTAGLPEVSPLTNVPAADGADFYFFVLEKDAAGQFFGSHFGQFRGMGDHVDGGTSRFDENGVIYQAICANCGGGATFPTTPGVWSSRNGSANCNLAVVKIEMNFSGVASSIRTSINGVIGSTRGCVPTTVSFSDTLLQAVKYYWDYGDGRKDTTTIASVNHTYNQVGNFLVMLIAEDSSTCNVRDTSYINIRIGNREVTPDFSFTKVPPCSNLTMQFTNTSTANFGGFNPRTFVWDYGDGSPPDTTSFNQIRTHAFPAPGTYFVILQNFDTSFCNVPVADTQRVSIFPNVKALFSTSPKGCVPYQPSFTNESIGGTEWLWDFGDGNTSTEFEPLHTYTTAGNYRVTLIARDPTTCNLVDTSAYFTITVYDIPTAVISSWGPNPPEINEPVRLINGSIGAVRYEWDFGDGSVSTERNPSHQYAASGDFNVRLVAFNAAGCSDTTYQTVQVLVQPKLDLPNAFTPGQFGENGIIKVRGFGVQKIDWKIYNRLGQLLFQSTSIDIGWDGRYKGKIQPMDVYTYTLDVEFFDGQKIKRTGDITLLR